MRATEFTEAKTYQPPEITVGDEVKIGKFKNRKAEVKGFSKDKHNQPVLKTSKGDTQLFKPRISKLQTEDEVIQTETKGLPFPGTYEQENDPFKKHGQKRIGTLTTEDQHWDKNPPKTNQEKMRFHHDQASLANNSVTKNHHLKRARHFRNLINAEKEGK